MGPNGTNPFEACQSLPTTNAASDEPFLVVKYLPAFKSAQGLLSGR